MSWVVSRTVILTSKVMLCIWWDQLGVVYYELLKLKQSQAVGIERNWCVWAEHWKTNGRNTEMRDTIKWFWQCSIPCCESGQDILGNVEMGNPTPLAVFSRRCSLWLSLVSINGTRPGWPALLVLWRSKKLDRFVDSLERWPVFSTRDSYATRK